MAERREVTIDFIAIVVTGVVLALLLTLSIIVNMWSLGQRQEEHNVIHEHLERVEREVEKMILAENNERKAIERARGQP